MKTTAYHHGNLRNELLETGIEFINQHGEDNLSLRKVAEKCGVSNAAPYAHFKNKNAFLVAMQQYVLDLFTQTLEKTIETYKDADNLLPMLGKSYIMFFYNNPLYYDFIFSRKNMKVKLALDDTDKNENRPFEILKSVAIKVFSKAHLPEKTIQNKIIAMWALVHGLAGISTMPNVEYDNNWEEQLEEIIISISIPYRTEEVAQ